MTEDRTQMAEGVGQPRGVALTIFYILLFVVWSDAFAIEWPWRKTKENQPPKGLTRRQMLDRNEINQHQLERQMLSGQKGTMVYTGSTYVDLYDEKGVATRVNLDQNGDGKVRVDDFLLAKKTSLQNNIPSGLNSVQTPAGFQKEDGLETLYLGRMEEEAASLAKEAAVVEKEIASIDNVQLPVLENTQRQLMNELFGFEEQISRIEGDLVHLGVEILKDEEGREEIRVPEGTPQRSTVERFLEERRQLLIQTAKIRGLIQAQELQRSQHLRHKKELEDKARVIQRDLNELKEEQKKIQGGMRDE